MPGVHELAPEECERALRSGVVGRVALTTPDGPHIVPVNYTVLDDTIVIRTTAYSVLGTYGRGAMLAFEVDHVEHDRRLAWSIVARGRCRAETDPEEIARVRARWSGPWAEGSRSMHLRIRWDSLTGRLLDGWHDAKASSDFVDQRLAAR